MKLFSSSGVINVVILVILCMLVALLINDRSRFVEGMTDGVVPVIATPLDALRSQITALQTVYDTLDTGITAQTNTIDGNSHILFQTMNGAPTQSNNITHANINMDDPSKTPMKTI